MEFYFAYGSNLLKAQMMRRCPGSMPVARAMLPGWKWTIGERGFATIAPSRARNAVVHGALYQITDRDEARLDVAEGVAIGCYGKFWLPILTPNREEPGEFHEVRALVYVDPRSAKGAPSPEYIHRCIAGAAAWRLPAETLNTMRHFS